MSNVRPQNMPFELWTPLLSLVSAAVGAGIGGWFALRSKNTDYANAYFRLVLDRRLAAYEEVERLVVQIKVAILDKDGRPYHALFSKDNDHDFVYKLLLGIMSRALWLSDDLFAETRALNVLIYSKTKSGAGLVEFGKENYRRIAELRTKIERLHARDMLALHQVPKFLKSKKPEDSFVELHTEA
jgi:hypothetical protein